jgi:hypothetical protein
MPPPAAHPTGRPAGEYALIFPPTYTTDGDVVASHAVFEEQLGAARIRT